MTNTYIDCIAYSKQPTGLVLGGYIGNMAHMSAAAQGATLLTVPPLIVALNQYDAVYVFDGPSSEELQVGAGGAIVGATSIPLESATQYAHNAGIPYCTDGSSGSLGEQIFTASRWIEDDICYQSLWSTTYTGEILTMPTMRAALDNQFNLHFRPRHFPITALTSMSIKTSQLSATSYDTSQAIIDADQQTVDVPLMAALSTQGQPQQGSPWLWPGLSRSVNAWITITYTSGFVVGQLPRPIERACALLTSECFQQAENPMGAAEIAQNKRHVIFALRGDQSGESLLVKQAKKLLSAYVTQAF